MASLRLSILFSVCAVLLAFSCASASTSTGNSGGEINASGLRCFPVPARSATICGVELIPGISYTFKYSPPQSLSNLGDEEVKNNFDTELKEYESIEGAYRELQDVKYELESRHAISEREDKRLDQFSDKHGEISSPLSSGDSKNIPTQTLHSRLENSIKVYEQNLARLERIRSLVNLMVSRGIFGPEQAKKLLVFAERWDLINESTHVQALLDDKKVSAAQLLDENQNLRNSLIDAHGSLGKASSGTRPLIHKGVQLGSVLARPSDESLAIAVPGNQTLFTTFKPLTTYIVDDQSLYAIRLSVDSPTPNGFHSQMNPKTPEVQVIAQDGRLGTATWEVDVQADKRFGEAQLVFHGELLRYADNESYTRGDKPAETNAIQLPVQAFTFTPVPTKGQARFDRFLTWVEHLFGALGAPITFFLAVVSIYTNRAKIRTFWKWLTDKMTSAARLTRKWLVRKKDKAHVGAQSTPK